MSGNEGDSWNERYNTEELSANRVGMQEGGDVTESSLAKMADAWFESISREDVRARMIVNYIDGVTNENVTRKDAKEIAKRAGVIDGE